MAELGGTRISETTNAVIANLTCANEQEEKNEEKEEEG